MKTKTTTYKVSAFETKADFTKKKNATVRTLSTEAQAMTRINILKRGGEFYGAIVKSSDGKFNQTFTF